MGSSHVVLMVAIIAVIVYFQIHFFKKNKELISKFKNIFPADATEEWSIDRMGDIRIISKYESELIEEREQIRQIILAKENQLNVKDQEKRSLESHIESAILSLSVDGDIIHENNKRRLSYIKGEITKLKNEIREKNNRLKELENLIEQNSNNNESNTRSIIVSSINRYLIKNKDSVVDFNLIKDIVDRNCDAKEEEIQTQNPVSLYLGLVGTMAGIIIGVVALIVSGSLTLTNGMGATDAISGVMELLEGVAIAMVSSVIGIILTTVGSLRIKDAKVETERKKHTFLSWMQTELLPKISSDVSSALVKLGGDLKDFNSTFADNAKLLQNTILGITEATKNQASLLNAVQRLDVARIAEVNVSVYDKLKNCSEELGTLGDNMNRINGGIEGATKIIGQQISEYGMRSADINDAAGKVDMATRDAQKQLKESIESSFKEYQDFVSKLYMGVKEHTESESKYYKEKIDALHQEILSKFGVLKKTEEELKNLTSVKENIAALEKTTARHGEKLDNLSQSIYALARSKMGDVGTFEPHKKMSKWISRTLWVVGTTTWLWFIVWTILSVIK